MDAQQAREFDEKLEMKFPISLPGVGRFRVNICKQRNEVGLVARYIVVDIPSMQQLGLSSITATAPRVGTSSPLKILSNSFIVTKNRS
jgi:Tfp pilus assembly ATPase PilU